MSLLMLRPGWQGDFHRILNPNSSKERRLQFKAGIPVDLKGRDLQAVAGDIDKALVHVRMDDKGRAKVVEPEEVARPVEKQDRPTSGGPVTTNTEAEPVGTKPE